MNKNAKIFVTGHRGMVGSALVRRLQAGGYTNIITRSQQELDLLRELVVWGTGTPRREFLYVDDVADACVFLMEQRFAGSLLNIGTGQDVTIRELAETIMDVVGFEGRIVFDASKPDGTMRKVLDVSLLNAQHWQASKSLPAGIADTYKAYRSAL
ncbi:MAG: NAD-dependent epimerase/dehydratase family protein [Candidatus Thiothrix sulfatifontis]|nr:MAG: NAD-dependent epimerase/dehydratase family protein [Candidatus Thiothrix sulfatifontis]